MMTQAELSAAAAKMPTGPSEFSAAEVCERGQAIYQSQIRSLVDTEENVGRLLSIDILSGDYEMGDDFHHIETVFCLRARQPNAVVYTLRIGYNAVSSRGGRIQRLPR